jgi:hypothetical protein
MLTYVQENGLAKAKGIRDNIGTDQRNKQIVTRVGDKGDRDAKCVGRKVGYKPSSP